MAKSIENKTANEDALNVAVRNKVQQSLVPINANVSELNELFISLAHNQFVTE